jgi:periplasmic divalent cation tolerance protein
MTKALVVYVTAPSKKEADRISEVLVAERLAACVSVVPEVWSRYWWQGHLESSRELLLVIKTLPSRYKALERRIRQLHSYEVPEILALPVVKGNPAYLFWLAESVKAPSPARGGRRKG